MAEEFNPSIGDVINCEKYGEGEIIEIGEKITIEFDKFGIVELDEDWVKENCEFLYNRPEMDEIFGTPPEISYSDIITPEELDGLDPFDRAVWDENFKLDLSIKAPDKQKPEVPDRQKPEAPDKQKPEVPDKQKPEVPDKQKCEEYRGQFISALRECGFILSEVSIKKLCDFSRFRENYSEYNTKVGHIRYNMLAECGDKNSADEFCRLLKAHLIKVGGIPDGIAYIMNAEQFEYGVPPRFYSSVPIAVIYGCGKPLSDSAWENIIKTSDSLNRPLVVIGNGEFVQKIKENSRLYNRFLACHITLERKTGNTSGEIIRVVNSIKTELTLKELSFSKDFNSELTVYVKEEYPAADMPEREFVEETVNRILINYINSQKNGNLRGSDVPDIRSVEAVLAQADSMLGLDSFKKDLREICRRKNELSLPINFALYRNRGIDAYGPLYIIAKLLYAMEIISSSEIKYIGDDELNEILKGKHIEANGVLFFSANKNLNTLENNQMNRLIDWMDSVMDGVIVFPLARQKKQCRSFFETYPGFAARMTYDLVLEDYTNEELYKILKDFCGEKNMKLADDEETKRLLCGKFETERSKATFANRLTVKAVFMELRRLWLAGGSRERVITADIVSQSLPSAELSDLDDLVGLDSIKKTLNDFKKRVEYMSFRRDRGMKSSNQSMHMMFTGNPGTGKTTVAQRIADILYYSGLLKTNKLVQAERKDLVSRYIGQTAEQTDVIIRSALGGVLFIDEAYSLYRKGDNNDFGLEAIETLITAMETYKDRLVVIFAGYKKEMLEFLDANPGIKSRIRYTFNFPDYTPDELVQMFERRMRQDEFEADESAVFAARKRIERFSRTKNFGNGRFVETLIQRAVNKRGLRPYSDENFNEITALDIPTDEELIGESGITPPDTDINTLIGLDSIKKQLKAFGERAKYEKQLRDTGINSSAAHMHMIFEGNPGTGKTVVAQSIAQLLYDEGVLITNNIVTAERKDLVAEYLGQTAVKTNAVIERALDGVLFIDEAYSLTNKTYSNTADFGGEVIETLITAMESYKDRLVVIFAGYKNEMKRFREANAGIDSRIGYTFDFPDYTTDELVEMFTVKMTNRGFILNPEDEIKKLAAKLVDYFRVTDHFGNGRFVDKVMSMTIVKRSQRNTDGTKEKLAEIIPEDIPTVADMAAVSSNGSALLNDADISAEKKRRTAVHETGHALVSKLLDPDCEMLDLSIISDAASYGRVFYYDKEFHTENSYKVMLARYFGGRNAERAVFGDQGTGCSADINEAKNLAAQMVNIYAMGEFGVTAADDLLREADKTATKLLTENIDVLKKIAEVLCERGTLSGKEFEKMLKELTAAK